MELLVSIGILSLLLGMLLPALSGVKAASRSLECQSNLRQMGIAAQHYATLWDMWPPALRYDIRDGVAHTIAWDWVTETISGELVSPGTLWQFTDNPSRVMQDPAYYGSTDNPNELYTGYNYNTSYLGAEAMWVAVGWDPVRFGIKPHACQRSDRCAMFGCGGFSGGANKFMRAPLSPNNWPLSLVYSGAQAFRHQGCTNVAYIDGHVGSVSQAKKGGRATEMLLNQVMDYPEHGFLSDDDSAYDPR